MDDTTAHHLNGGRVKAALVGISGYGDHYLEWLLNDPRARQLDLVGVADPAPHRCRRTAQLAARAIPVYPSFESLLDAGPIDLAMICTPIHLHAPQTCAALERGINVLCEKPLAGSAADATRMLAAQKRSAAFAAIGYQWSFSAAVQALKADIAAGVLGRPIRLRALVCFPRPLSYFKRNDWAGKLKSVDGRAVLDSPANNATAHYLHNMLYVLGETRETSASIADVQAELYRANEIDNYDTCAIRCRTASGVEVLFYTTHAVADRAGPQSVYEFEHATVVHDDIGAGQFIARFRDGRVRAYGNPNLDRHEKIAQCATSVRTGQPVACGIVGAMPHTLCVLAAQKSVGRIVDFPPAVLTRMDCGDDTMLVVRGLAEVITSCYERGVLPAELGGVPWAEPGRAVPVGEPSIASAGVEHEPSTEPQTA